MVLGGILCCIREKITVNVELFRFPWYKQSTSGGERPYLQFISRYKELCNVGGPFKKRDFFVIITKTVVSVKMSFPS